MLVASTSLLTELVQKDRLCTAASSQHIIGKYVTLEECAAAIRKKGAAECDQTYVNFADDVGTERSCGCIEPKAQCEFGESWTPQPKMSIWRMSTLVATSASTVTYALKECKKQVSGVAKAFKYSKIGGAGLCANDKGQANTARKFVKAGVSLEDLQKTCAQDIGCVGVAYSANEVNTLYTGTGCTQDCTKADWLQNLKLITKASGAKGYECHVKQGAKTEDSPATCYAACNNPQLPTCGTKRAYSSAKTIRGEASSGKTKETCRDLCLAKPLCTHWDFDGTCKLRDSTGAKGAETSNTTTGFGPKNCIFASEKETTHTYQCDGAFNCVPKNGSLSLFREYELTKVCLNPSELKKSPGLRLACLDGHAHAYCWHRF